MEIGAYSYAVGPTADGGDLPPSCIAEPPRVHLPHITHTNDPNDEVLHLVKPLPWGSASVSS